MINHTNETDSDPSVSQLHYVISYPSPSPSSPTTLTPLSLLLGTLSKSTSGKYGSSPLTLSGSSSSNTTPILANGFNRCHTLSIHPLLRLGTPAAAYTISVIRLSTALICALVSPTGKTAGPCFTLTGPLTPYTLRFGRFHCLSVGSSTAGSAVWLASTTNPISGSGLAGGHRSMEKNRGLAPRTTLAAKSHDRSRSSKIFTGVSSSAPPRGRKSR